MRLWVHRTLRVASALLFTILIAGSSNSQTPSELRALYGEPQMVKMKNGRPTVERFLVRPKILMTITYDKDGRLCEASLDPVPGMIPATPVPENPPTGDYMSTAEVISVINELVPPETRGKTTNAFHINGGDPKMILNHPGCLGGDWMSFENVYVGSSSWCGGGTFSATVHWKSAKCRGKVFLKTKKH